MLVIPLIGVYKYDLFALHQLVTSNNSYNKEISNCSIFNILPGATTHYVDHRQHFQPCKFETTQIRFDPISFVLDASKSVAKFFLTALRPEISVCNGEQNEYDYSWSCQVSAEDKYVPFVCRIR